MNEIVTKRGILAGGNSISSNIDAKEVSIHEFNNPTSVAYMVPDVVRERLEEIPPDLFGCSERELIRKLEPNATDETLRLAFWDEYTVSVDAKRRMRMEYVFRNICTKEYFYKKVITNPLRFAYILRPPMEYSFKMRDLLELGHRRMREILELPIKNIKGNPDTKLIAEMVKIVALVENRVRGAVVNKVQVEQKNVNINVDAPKDYFEITDELKQLEKEIRSLEGVSEPSRGAREVTDVERQEVEVIESQGGDEG